MEIEVFGNKLKLENGEIYNFRKIHYTNEKMEWFKITFRLIKGYLNCSLTNNKVRRLFSFHRLMYYFYNPDFDIFNKELIIDHISRNTLDNSIGNLRKVSQQENQFNTDAKGCSFHKKSGKWRAQININKKRKYLGSYKTEEEARSKYLETKKKYHIISS